jgi:hypothetical protein
MLVFVLYAVMLCGVLETAAYDFDTIENLYSARFANCTQKEEKLMKCINGVCLARTDTIHRQAFCLCLSGFDGLRCETSEIPHIPMQSLCSVCDNFPYVPMCIMICCVIICIFLVLTYFVYYKTRIQNVAASLHS